MSRRPTKSAASPGDGSAPLAKNEWIAKIDRWRDMQKMQEWRQACEKIRDRYRYEDSKNSRRRKFQLLWSNMETMKGATYAKPPHAEVMRRFRDKDQTARVATQAVERCINYTLDAEDYDSTFKKVRDDFLLDARGVARVRYEPVMEAAALPDDGLDGADAEGVGAEVGYIGREAAEAGETMPDDEASEIGEEGQSAEPDEILTFERVPIQYVHRDDFVHDPARTWEEVGVVGFRSFLTRAKLRKRFPQEVDGRILGDLIELDAKSDTQAGKENPGDQYEPKATIWELWDKDENKVRWVAVGYPDVLEESEPYLKFKDFWPCPKPAFGTLTNDTLVPRPDFIFYQDQAEEIDALTARIASLQDSLKLVGFYPGGPKGEGTPEVERAVTPGVENKMIAVQGWENFTTKGGGKAPIIWLPIEDVAKVLEGCVKLRQQLIEDVNSIYGLTDIMRGAGDPNETATAQGIKAQFGSLRIRTRQQELARFCRDITRLVGEVICNHFQPETIMSMANMPLPTDAEVLAQVQAEQMAQAQQAAMQAHQQAMQQQAAMMGHNGAPPMGAPPMGAAPQPGGI